MTIDINELREAIQTFGSQAINEGDLTELLDRLEAAEKGHDELHTAVCREGDRADAYQVEVFVLRARLEAAEKERDALRAELLDARETVRELFHGAGVANMTITALRAKLESPEKDTCEKALEISEKTVRDLTEKVIPNIREQLEAAEKDIALKERVVDSLGSELNAVANERDALQAKVEAMERQKPVASVWRCDNDHIHGSCERTLPMGTKLYALPGAKGD